MGSAALPGSAAEPIDLLDDDAMCLALDNAIARPTATSPAVPMTDVRALDGAANGAAAAAPLPNEASSPEWRLVAPWATGTWLTEEQLDTCISGRAIPAECFKRESHSMSHSGRSSSSWAWWADL